MTSLRKLIQGCLALFFLVFAIYSQVADCDFVRFDDYSHVLKNQYVLSGLTWNSVVYASTHFIACEWLPLSWVSHMIDVSLFGLNPGAHHLVNVAFHAANACLVFIVFWRLTEELWPSFVVALLFAVHPINVESVAWIAERKNVLSTLFWLLAMNAYASYAKARLDRPLRGMAAVTAWMALSLMAKPMGVTLPFALLLLDYWPLRRFENTSCRRLFLEKTPLFVLSALVSAITIHGGAENNKLLSTRTFTPAARLASAFSGYFRYLGKIFAPHNLAVFYPLRYHLPAPRVAVSITLVVAVTISALLLRKRAPYLFAGWAWFLGVLLPVSGILQMGAQALADRFAYLPELGIFWAVVWSAKELPLKYQRVILAAGGVATILQACLTIRQVSYWMDTTTLFEHALQVTEPNAVAFMNAGAGRMQRKDYLAAAAHFRNAAKLLPKNPVVHASLGEAYLRADEMAPANAELRYALKLDPSNSEARVYLAVLLTKEGKLDEASALVRNRPR